MTLPSRRWLFSGRSVITAGVRICTNAHLERPRTQQPSLIAAKETTGHSPSTAVDRRQVLTSFGAIGVATVLASAPAQSEECELVDSPSGLQFCDVEEGTGDAASKGTLIRAHYTGRLASNLKVFDSSYPRGQPLVFNVGAREVIKGWDMGILGTEGIPAMKAGGKRRLVIPPELAYGSRGAGRGVIPPDATLVFDVEYLGLR